MSRVINCSELSDAITKELETYNKDVIAGVKKEAKTSMDKLVRDTKATAPRGRTRKYYRSITSKKEWENSLGAGYIWYVKAPRYRLSHLLEYGHAKRNHRGRTKAFGFIKRASDPIINSYVKNVEEILKNGK